MSDDFDARLQSAIARGKKRAEMKAQAQRQKELSVEELRSLHTNYRLALSDQIEAAIQRIADHFPGFRQESLFGENGWGTACYRDDLRIESGRRSNEYSRLEMVIRPFSDLHVLDMKSKGTILNRELFNRSHFVPVAEVNLEEFENLIETWSLEYAELFAAS